MSEMAKPCPFCGHDDIEINEIEPGRFAIDCPECECIGPFNDSVKGAIEAWNMPAEQRDELLTALHVALPFVEDWEGDKCYKIGAVKKAVAQIKAAIAQVRS